MLRSAALLTCTVLLATPGLAQPKLEATDIAKGGLFRSFRTTGIGYRLRAHVGAGELTLR